MVIMRILGLSVDSTAKTPILLLQEEGEKRVLPIWIGSMEAMSISLALSGQEVPRPLTHDLLLSTVASLHAVVESIEIINFDKGIFYADLVVRQQEAVYRIDCRPSDGITLAIKLGLPIYVHAEVLENALHAEQRQDAASFQNQKPEEDINTMLRQQMDIKQETTKEQILSTTSRLILDEKTGMLVKDTSWKPPQEAKDAPQEEVSSKAQDKEATTMKSKIEKFPQEVQGKVSVQQKPRVQHITITPQPKANVKTLTHASSLQEGDKDVEKLLRSMEPPSSKPM